MSSPAVCCCSVRPHKSGFSFGPDHLSHVVLVAWCLVMRWKHQEEESWAGEMMMLPEYRLSICLAKLPS